jgi:membrane-associated phospholipid phosphatase
MSELIKKSGSVILKLKYHYNRPRPFQWAKENNVELNGVDLESSQSPSFPSGHAGQAVITALVLSELYPELEEKLKDLAQEISYSRNMAKVHYPSDTKVGKEVARDMFEYLKESGELQKLFKKYEIKKKSKG